ncbi:MAG: phage tail tube protein [Oligoflexales bacterium]
MRIGGIFYLKIDGKIVITTEVEFTYNFGKPKRQAEKNSALGVAGFSAEAQVPYIDGEIFDTESLEVEELLDNENATVILELQMGRHLS